MRRLIFGAVLALALLAAGTAGAGGWATVQLSSTPTGLGPGDPWDVDITVLQHGNAETPVLNAVPRLTIQNTKTGEATSYDATPTETRGVYHVRAGFPEAGVWSYRVYDGFEEFGGAQTHTFAPVTIAGPTTPAAAPAQEPTPAAAAPDDGFPVWPVALGGALALAAALGLGALARRGRATPAH